jgi:hypothetical protein
LPSYDEAVEICKAKVSGIVEECLRANCKYSDPDFDIEFDLRFKERNCLDKLNVYPLPDSKEKLKPQSGKRVGDIFYHPKFYINGPTPNDVRQGDFGNCLLIAALSAMWNKPGLIEKVSVARDEAVRSMDLCSFVMGSGGQKSSPISYI